MGVAVSMKSFTKTGRGPDVAPRTVIFQSLVYSSSSQTLDLRPFYILKIIEGRSQRLLLMFTLLEIKTEKV